METNDANDRYNERERGGDGNCEPEPAEKTIVTLSNHLRRNADKRGTSHRRDEELERGIDGDGDAGDRRQQQHRGPFHERMRDSI